MCSYCCRFPLNVSAGKLERAGQVLICVSKQEREYINDFTSDRERMKQQLAFEAGTPPLRSKHSSSNFSSD